MWPVDKIFGVSWRIQFSCFLHEQREFRLGPCGSQWAVPKYSTVPT